MNNFYYQIPTEIFFGKGQIEQLEKEIPKYGNKVLLVYGGGSIKRMGLYQAIYAIFARIGVEVTELPGVEPNPRIETVRAGVELCRKNAIEVIIAAGGGSTIDCAKVISAGANYAGDSWDIVTGAAPVTETLPVLAILTLAATGSEMDRFAVISNMKTNDKLGAFSPLFYPKVSILDPEYTFTVPKNQTAAGTADIMSHIFEHYFNNVQGAYVQNRLAEGLLKTCIHYGPIAYNEPENYEARANLMWVSSLAIDGITWRGNDVATSVHPMEHELSAYYDITHGVGLAILTPHWMKYVLNDKTLDRFVEYGVNVWGIDPALDKFAIAGKAIEKTADFFRALEIPATLREVGIDDAHLEIMAEKAAKGMKKAFYPLTSHDVLNIFRAAL
ncbi:iron-containing alcohol dehydrogenase [Desulfosporosinus sp. PR]|uniref:iron-containing alcohol dehydrogenase n=1 Tax=Candidatus Desulfosporosinus nitrosoreducens TaxID=3401928 RepID=UPI0027F70033|nr:iron-containing alcohol dehydrogenase [Desulfosporosinus sp. PR]MDQ7094653.1 iron-containing alcohol dehydrogenase [Desulfosporosinus sp. PR]